MKTNFYIALGAFALAVIMLGLSFIPALGVYMLISSVLMELIALSFLNTQKKKENFKAVTYMTIAAYILLGVSVAIFAGGLIYTLVLNF